MEEKHAQDPQFDQATSTLLLDWVGVCRRIVEMQKEIVSDYRERADLTEYFGRGASGDLTLLIDREFEDAVFRELDTISAGSDFIVISEERGEVVFGSNKSPVRVVIDPIDGSENVKRGIPAFGLSIAVADGPTMADVAFAYVYDFGTNEEWVAQRGRGAKLDGRPLDPQRLSEIVSRATATYTGPLGIVGFESAEPRLMRGAVDFLIGQAYLLRVVGSIAITLCYVGAARMDAMLTSGTCRSVDAAAGQLIARESGALVAFEGLDLSEASLGLDARYRVVAARTGEALKVVKAAQAATGPNI
jgi:myo-inositol-1(or 4)-monophosphatase